MQGYMLLEMWRFLIPSPGSPGKNFSYALNQRLPEDIRIQLSEEVEPDFHPRYCDSEKTYEYRILNRKFPVPTERLYSYFYHYKLDVDKMKEATSYLIGRHDFASFCGSGAQVKTTIRTITSMDVWRDGDMVTIRVSGTGFLYNMVRIISGTLIEIGNGQYPPERMDKILKACDRAAAGPTAPAQGLTLMGIEFFLKKVRKRGTEMKNTQDLLHGNIKSELIALTIPLVLGNILQQFYNTIDSFIVGRYVGTEAFAGIGVAGSIMNLFIFILNGGCNGMSIIFAELYGQKNYEKTSKRKLPFAERGRGLYHCFEYCKPSGSVSGAGPDPDTAGGRALCCGLSSDHFYRTSCHLPL